jgi:MFS family permease
MAFLFLISAIGTGLANNIAGFIFFRIIGGLAIGGASVLSPIYITEIAPAKYRGRFTLLFHCRWLLEFWQHLPLILRL